MKRGIAIFSILLFSTILLSGFASAGFWGDLWSALTGGKPQFSPSDDTEITHHSECNNGQCITVTGKGFNECNFNSDCLGSTSSSGNETNQTRSVCSGNSCIVVQGAGTNECSTNADCVTNTTNQTRSVCSGYSCIVVQDAGTNECSTNADCVPNTTQNHSVCSGNSCIVVQGAGTNQCSTNADCSTAGNETNATGTASFTSTPTGATVRYRVQGTTTWQFVSGRTPLNIELEPNNYEGKASKQPLYADHTNPDLDFTITAGQTTNVHFTLNQTHHASCISNATCTPMLGPGPTTCEGSPLGSTCSSGNQTNGTINCYSNADCPPIPGALYCHPNGNDLCNAVATTYCRNPGTSQSECITNTTGEECTPCEFGCLNNGCVLNTTNTTQPPLSVSPIMPKNRYISFIPQNSGKQTALKVTLDNVPGLEGRTLWVGPHKKVSELSSTTEPTPPTLNIAQLQCSPYYTDWGAVGEVHVFGPEVIPNKSYTIQATEDDSTFSSSLNVKTARWGDIIETCTETSCSAPDGSVNVNDAIAVLSGFSNAPNAPSKARTDLDSDQLINIVDALYSLQAFQGLQYPFGIESCLGNVAGTGGVMSVSVPTEEDAVRIAEKKLNCKEGADYTADIIFSGSDTLWSIGMDKTTVEVNPITEDAVNTGVPSNTQACEKVNIIIRAIRKIFG
jgi:hypothetical protein